MFLHLFSTVQYLLNPSSVFVTESLLTFSCCVGCILQDTCCVEVGWKNTVPDFGTGFVQRDGGCPIFGDIQGQVGWGSQQND